MDSGYYAAMTGLMARTQALDTAAANLANAQTPGYRAEREYFRSALLGTERVEIRNWAGCQSLRTARWRPAEHGARIRCSRPATRSIWHIEGDGFFAVQTANGVRYTRDGSFHRSQSGVVVTQPNEPVLSSTGSDSDSAGRGSVGADGVISVSGRAVATVGVFCFADWRATRAGGRQPLRRAPDGSRRLRSGDAPPGSPGRI